MCTKTCICCEFVVMVGYDASNIELSCVKLNDIADKGLWGECTDFKAVEDGE